MAFNRINYIPYKPKPKTRLTQNYLYTEDGFPFQVLHTRLAPDCCGAMAALFVSFTLMTSFLYGQANPCTPSQRRECLRVRCISKSASRVMREVEKAGKNGRSVVRKSRHLPRVVQLEVLEELLERDHCEFVLPVPLTSLSPSDNLPRKSIFLVQCRCPRSDLS